MRYTFTTLSPIGLEGVRWKGFYDALPRERRFIHFSPGYADAQMIPFTSFARLAVCFDEEDHFVMQPFQLDTATAKDIKSFYGYGGPNTNVDEPLVSFAGDPLVEIERKNRATLFAAFNEALLAWAKANEVVCEYCALHPALGPLQHEILGASVHRDHIKDVVMMRADKLYEPMLDRMRDTRRHCIEKARKAGVQIQASSESVFSFAPKYEETMKRLGAPKRFRFRPQYFYRHVGMLPWNCLMLAARDAIGNYLAGAMLLLGGTVAQYQFAATGEKPVPGVSDLLVLEAAHMAALCGADWLDLGGGTSSDADDTLLSYKRSFSKELVPFETYRRIFDQAAYEAVCVRTGHFDEDSDSNFFPAYRRDEIET